jgi:hypothetical protein
MIRQSFSPYSMAILRYNIYIHMHIPIYTPFWSPYGSWSHVLMSPRLHLWLDQRSSSQGDGDPQAEDPHATNWSWKLQNLHSHVVYNIYNRLSILVYTYMKKKDVEILNPIPWIFWNRGIPPVSKVIHNRGFSMLHLSVTLQDASWISQKSWSRTMLSPPSCGICLVIYRSFSRF